MLNKCLQARTRFLGISWFWKLLRTGELYFCDRMRLLLVCVSLAVAAIVVAANTTPVYQKVDNKNCFDCSMLNRDGPVCPNLVIECTNCLEGYDEVFHDDTQQPKPPCVFPPTETLFSCQDKNDCESGYFCYGIMCLPCLNCDAFLRQASPDCAIKVNECGECLPGFIEVAVRGQSYKNCQHPPNEPPSRVAYQSALLSVMLVIALFFCGVLLFQRYGEGCHFYRRFW